MIAVLVEGISDRVLWVMKWRSLFDLGNRRSGFTGSEGRSLFDFGK
ncbi:MAG: hypothetical protein IM535_03895 [Pseudanabaena sp. M38BS1SP1A06MG]|nr:hypothetical protein [Pseudanabaena sp. M53BS1SP1A06MG]MCA6581436.1 hypothetical protein [Pseudanabaena sp. M34BS1SP1A06MG]MCA6591259.1 hypothetical protein [Pseudanabaena sp. M38BS1SP1A06MG]